MNWFNNRCLLELIGNIPPAEAEANFYAVLKPEDMAAQLIIITSGTPRAIHIPFFGSYPAIRKFIYTTNAIESLNRVIRRSIKTRGLFPTDEAATKLTYLAIRKSKTTAEMSGTGLPPAISLP